MNLTFDDKIEPGDVIAVGDIHATWTLFEPLLEWVKGTGATLVLLGDLIDRGGEDLKVLDAVQNLLENPEGWGLEAVHVLKGNHEKMFEDCLGDFYYQPYAIWRDNGGNEEQFEEMRDRHGEWIANLPVYLVIGETLFVHGGVRPGEDPAVTLRWSGAGTLLWMRQPFLERGPELEKWTTNLKRVVHGHTPTFFETGLDGMPVVTEQRINIDTGAFINNKKVQGKLTAYNVTRNAFKQFAHA